MTFQAGVESQWTNDTQRFLLEHFDTIHTSPSHIYHSALPLSPSSSWLYKCYSTELSSMVKVVKGPSARWGMCSRTISLDGIPEALSYWDNAIAIGSGLGDIIILNAVTGIQTAVLSGHTGQVNSLIFLPDGTSLVSGSNDETAKLWDLQTGGVVKTFSGHTGPVWSVSISADHTTIASGSKDHTIRLWDIQTGECYQTIKHHDTVLHVWFSPTDSQYLMSVSDDKVWQWDTNGHQLKSPCEGTWIAFSSDGTQFVLRNHRDVTVQNCDSGVVVAEFCVALSHAQDCCFSPDGRLLAVAVESTVVIWDITSSNPCCVETIVGHTSGITSFAFSSPSTLISTSADKSVKFWQIGALSTNPVGTNPNSTFSTPAPIRSITLQAKDGVIVTSDSDGVVKTWDIPTGLCIASFQTLVHSDHKEDGQSVNDQLVDDQPMDDQVVDDQVVDDQLVDDQSINGQLIRGGLINGRLIIFQYDEQIKIWDAEKGELLLAVDTPDKLEDLRISGDGSIIFGLGGDYIQAWSIQTGEVVGEVEIEHSTHLGTLTVDGLKVWAHHPDLGYQGWDFGIQGSSPVQLPNILSHPSGNIFWDVDVSGIKDSDTTKAIFQLSGSFAKPSDVQCDGHYLVAGYESGELLILESNNVLLQY